MGAHESKFALECIMGLIAKTFIVCLILFTQTLVFAKDRVVQILHTNDLHSHYSHNQQKDAGGLARIKALMDKLEAEGDAKGWVTIRLDAGDFSEGHLNYFVNRGDVSFDLMKMMNYDAIALGNHDYLTGVAELERQYNEGRNLPLVAANFSWENHNTNIEPGRLIVRSGLRIAVAGATTNELYYGWAVRPATITDPSLPVETWLSNQRADLKIVLSHIGLWADKTLAQQTSSVDVIVGGHSHTVMQKPFWITNKTGKRPVPIVQTGSEGRYLGQLVIKLPSAARTRILSYKLHPISLGMPEDPGIKALVQSSRVELSQILNTNLDAVVAHSKERFSTNSSKAPIAGNFFADVLKETANADIALDFGTLYGDGFNKGDLTVEDIMMLQPHTYDWNTRGWHIYTARISGARLKLFMKLLTFQDNPVFVSGMEVELNRLRKFKKFLVNGLPVDKNKIYTIALSEGFLAGAKANTLTKKFFRGPYLDTGVVFREAIYTKALEIKNFTQETFGSPRVIWPGSDIVFNIPL